jgi:hypothetical protein
VTPVYQPLARVEAINEPEVRGWLVEAEKFLEPLGQQADLGGVGAEGVRLAGAEPRLLVVDDDAEPGPGAGVGSGTVVKPAGEE